jgi:hypothetical protein
LSKDGSDSPPAEHGPTAEHDCYLLTVVAKINVEETLENTMPNNNSARSGPSSSITKHLASNVPQGLHKRLPETHAPKHYTG